MDRRYGQTSARVHSTLETNFESPTRKSLFEFSLNFDFARSEWLE